ncbi:hypothetical protein [Streptomyces sp. NPDC056227]|uniref:Gfo/Idh/MocA family protein n=1 Tax=Streptomyces sp. NPDC056227 TaxID=3345753 RepID=UPI0035E0D061
MESECAYSAKRVYLSGLRNGGTKQYFTKVMSGGELTEEAVATALAEGPYGRCVYRSDNDVVDHQVVSLEFEGGATASFTLSAFTPLENRHTKIFGTRGQLTGDGRYIEVYDFLTERTTVIDTSRDGSSAAEGHAWLTRYNTRRRHSANGHLSRNEYEHRHHTAKLTLAA